MIIALFILHMLTPGLAQVSVKASFDLNPAGDFIARTSSVTGFAELLNDGSVKADKVSVALATLKSEVKLRDQHIQKRLQTNRFPRAILTNATGKNGKGKGWLQVMDKKKEISGSYSVQNKFLTANFKLLLSDFGIDDVNYLGVGVEDEFEIEVSLPLKKASTKK